jgi:hypothetical protein
MVIGLESGGRLTERAGNGGYTSGADGMWGKLSKLSSKKRTNVIWLQT